jgi:hypothetical protein
MKPLLFCVIVLLLILCGVLVASNKINVNQLLGPGASQNGFVIGVLPGGTVTFLSLGAGLSITGNTLSASAALPNFADYIQIPGTPNGTTTAFTLANTPSPLTSLGVFKNGQLLQSGEGNDYALAGAVVTFSVAPLATDNLQASYRF